MATGTAQDRLLIKMYFSPPLDVLEKQSAEEHKNDTEKMEKKRRSKGTRLALKCALLAPPQAAQNSLEQGQAAVLPQRRRERSRSSVANGVVFKTASSPL